MAIKGEKFELDLDSSEEEAPQYQSLSSTTLFVKDILEKEDNNNIPPSPPKLKPTSNGFPKPRVRKAPSRFKQDIKGTMDVLQPSSKKSVSFDEEEMKRIDQENRQKIQNMTPEEIEHERKELLAGLSGSLIERLLKRSNIEEPQDDFDKPLGENTQVPAKTASLPTEKKTVKFADIDTPPAAESVADDSIHVPPQSDSSPEPATRTIHPPSAPVPSLDPSSSTFLHDLHQKYFPTLPYDPQSLAWMTPLPPQLASDPISYSPSASSFSPAELRFDFSGNLLPPNLAHQIPTSKGLHHHGLAPEAAGYTIPELSIYARSTVQAQRCMAFQTLGRFLFKLGTGIFGDDGGPEGDIIDEEDEGAVLCRGLWDEVHKEHILDILLEEADKDEGLTRHRSAHALAVEAVWLWKRGGGRWPGKMQDPSATESAPSELGEV